MKKDTKSKSTGPRTRATRAVKTASPASAGTNDVPANVIALAGGNPTSPDAIREALSRFEVHAHPGVIQIHDGRGETPLALITSPRGQPEDLVFITSGMAMWPIRVRRFDYTGKEIS